MSSSRGLGLASVAGVLYEGAAVTGLVIAGGRGPKHKNGVQQLVCVVML